MGYELDDTGSESWLKQEKFLFSETSRPALGPTQPSIKSLQWIPSREAKRPERESKVSFQSVIKISVCVED